MKKPRHRMRWLVFQSMPFPSCYIYVNAILSTRKEVEAYVKANGGRCVAVLSEILPASGTPRPQGYPGRSVSGMETWPVQEQWCHHNIKTVHCIQCDNQIASLRAKVALLEKVAEAARPFAVVGPPSVCSEETVLKQDAEVEALTAVLSALDKEQIQ